MDGFAAIVGHGVHAVLDGQIPLFLADSQQVVALFGIADTIKPDAANGTRALQQRGRKVIRNGGDECHPAGTATGQVHGKKVMPRLLREQGYRPHHPQQKRTVASTASALHSHHPG